MKKLYLYRSDHLTFISTIVEKRAPRKLGERTFTNSGIAVPVLITVRNGDLTEVRVGSEIGNWNGFHTPVGAYHHGHKGGRWVELDQVHPKVRRSLESLTTRLQ